MTSLPQLKQDLISYGITGAPGIVHNPDWDTLFEHETDPALSGFGKGILTDNGAVAVDTGIFTGRSPKDKYIVRDEATRDTLWWSDAAKGKNDNHPLSPEVWSSLKGL